MRINTVFSKKISTGDYENETYTVTVEAESEFNHIEQVADFLFAQARLAVQRQLEGAASNEMPTTTMPPATLTTATVTMTATEAENGGAAEKAAEPKPTTDKPKDADKGKALATTKQVSMILKLLEEVFDNEAEGFGWLKKQAGTARVKDLSRRVASKIIEQLIDRQRNVA